MTVQQADVSTDREVIAQDAMSAPVVTIPDSGTIFDAWSVMTTCRVRHAVVVRGDHCVGVVTDRDLVAAWQQGPGALRATPIKSLLSARTSCVLPEASLRQVAEIMNCGAVDAVPVVEATGKLIGLVTAGDVVDAVSKHGLHVPAEPAASLEVHT